jgi:urease accessory protein
MSTEAMRLWQLISPTLPVGAFHYSQGLEQAVERNWVVDTKSAEDWIGGISQQVLAWLDLPLIKRIHTAWCERDEAAVAHWNAVSRACRETAELRDEEQQMGVALTALARSMDEPLPRRAIGFTAAFAVLSANNNIAVEDAMMGYGWAWYENQVMAAIKLVPLGHRAGQLMLRCLTGELELAVATAESCSDAELGRTTPGFFLASCAHETQYTRLFRS